MKDVRLGTVHTVHAVHTVHTVQEVRMPRLAQPSVPLESVSTWRETPVLLAFTQGFGNLRE